ncbi:hypothetical protein A2210_00210 [Candidatus Woesebacteria bacterium RIFOXYA1_FULL_40_18]|uniref:LTD domain-containing protein n=2 Tax=Candidatus Woeseibacteriota TaxID=1752722 RepID=A0A1F8CJ91_9BACT|nr:MAG: hypothetical protein A2210_00210 [Candidatus Woesebacteria bacterium RIFOXYA1_FULL_40_18]OGM80774.1 MAG: hypothetical protein A2361_00980 [Candidatus Woesebacteria bacterium RIFOXYB1_FULL_40_26]
MKTILKLAILILILAIPQIGVSNSYFTDSENIEGNSISTGVWGEPTVPEVVINEVMWMGSTVNYRDEWIELRNMTGSPVDIGQWTIEKVTDTGTRILHIPASRTIPSNGYFLIANYPKTSANSALNIDINEVNNSIELLNSGNGNLILKDRDGNIVDQAKGDTWPAGFSDGTSSGLHKSMERNDIPGDGLLVASWHTCIDSHCNDTTYWDTEGNNYGTPGSPNLSRNDSTETNLNFYTLGEHSVGFRLTGEGLSLFDKAEYTITYNSDQGEQAMKGSIDIGDKSEVEVNNLLLGTCSSGGICVYNSGVDTVKLEIILSGPITRTLSTHL